MKLIRAAFENFRLLRNLELEFSTDAKRKLTVIRAANETGKTTVLNALQWALYGDAALPNKGEDYRLHPIDWDGALGRRVPITATVEFEVTKFHKGGAGLTETRRRYRIVRSAFEEVDGVTWKRAQSTVRLFALTEVGASPLDNPDAFINDELPPDLREVFFTDGDRALSFIEADVALATKRGRVQRAIRSLLGLSVLEDAIHHVRKAAGEVNRQAKKAGTGGELASIASDLESLDQDVAGLESELEDAKQQFSAFDEKLNDVDRRIAAALQKGDKEKLQKDLEAAKREMAKLDERIDAAIKDHANLFRGEPLASDLLGPVLERSFEILEKLHQQGKIPKTTIPILRDRLDARVCICGESLEDDGTDGARRRKHIAHLIEESEKPDALQEIITDLYFGSKNLGTTGESRDSRWIATFKQVVENRDGLQVLRDDAGRKYRTLELTIDDLPDTDIQGLRETRRDYLKQRDRFLQKQSSCETKLLNLRRRREELTFQRDRLLREQKKGARILAELEVTQDICRVLESSYQRITNEELAKVSELMNRNFLEMIGADPEQGAIIRRAEISRDFDIIVFGPNDRTLNPDRDLNGASRRALSLAFILALTKVSEVEAPNVIDTPLGMMSGHVKRLVLRTAIRESSQIVLFLMHSEILGCEELLDEAAGVVTTLTNPAHYPKMLVNDPRVDERRVLRCDCNHRNACQICERRSDADVLLETTT